MSTARLTKKYRRLLVQRALEGALRSIMPLYPEYDRPGFADIEIRVKPKHSINYLLVRESYTLP